VEKIPPASRLFNSRGGVAGGIVPDCVTGRFLGKGDLWHERPDKARDFGSNKKAIDYYVSNQLEDVQIVMHFEPDPDLALSSR